MSGEHFNSVQEPYSEVVGPSSPVQRTLGLLAELIDDEPSPRIERGRSGALLLATHVVLLMRAAGQLNAAGFHSPAATLFRPIEDALDCFAAVSLVDGCAEAWERGDLPASTAAKRWTSNPDDHRDVLFLSANVTSLSEYRESLRMQYNDFAHCHPRLANWNVYTAPQEGEANRLRLRLNTRPDQIARNAHAIDAHLTASLVEFLDHVERAYAEYLADHKPLALQLADCRSETETLLREHSQNGCLDVATSPELRRLR